MINLSSEKIFYTLQGEGKFAGVPSVFIRLSGCNLRCAWKNPDDSITTCDTPHSSHNAELFPTEISEIITEVLKYPIGSHAVITGGEPFLQAEVVDLINELKSLGKTVTVETNGTIYRENNADYLSISPKLSTSEAMRKSNRIILGSLKDFVENHDCQLKFVYNTASDLIEIDQIIAQLSQVLKQGIDKNIYLMPQGTTNQQLDSKMKEIFEVCKNRGWKYTDRLHIRAYGHIKGV